MSVYTGRPVGRPSSLASDLPLLTAIRFFASFWVFAFHYWSWVGLPSVGIWRAAGSGARGVDLFFVLSGFVIMHVYGRRRTGRAFGFGTFMWRRFARVYPLHVAMLLIWVVFLLGLASVGYDLDRAPTWRDLIASLLLVHSWHTTDGLLLNGVSWSVSAEMSAYLAFGIAMLCLPRPPGWLFWGVTFVVTAVVAHVVAVTHGYPGFMHPDWDFGGLRIFPSFALGALMRLAADHVNTRLAAVIGVLAVAGLAVAVQDPNADYVLLPLFAALILAAARLSPVMGRLPGMGILVYLGEISYSTYMVHSLILLIYANAGPQVFASWGAIPQTVHASIAFAIVIAASAVSYHLIEQPSRRWLNALWTRHARPGRAGPVRETS